MFRPHLYTHCASDSLWEQEPLVDGVDGVVGFNVTLPLQQDRSGIQSVVGPEHREPALLVSMDQGPACQRHRAGKTLAVVAMPTPQPDEHHVTHQLMAEAPRWRGSRDGW